MRTSTSFTSGTTGQEQCAKNDCEGRRLTGIRDVQFPAGPCLRWDRVTGDELWGSGIDTPFPSPFGSSGARHPLAYATSTPLTFLFDGSSPAMPSAWKPNEISAPAAIVPFQAAFLIT